MPHLRLLDTHTGGEPTRVIIEASLNMPIGDALAQRNWLREHADWTRRAALLEPRGCESMVGAWLGPAANPDCVAAVVFFNNVGYLGMCGHGLIGVVEAMRAMGTLNVGSHQFDTPAGPIKVTLHDDHRVTFQNVPSERYRARVAVCVDASPLSDRDGFVIGDIAYGGNWFYLIDVPDLTMRSPAQWTGVCLRIRASLKEQCITGPNGNEIDHIELSEPWSSTEFGGRNFVLCPGGHYDRSPCGTGTSAKLACLAAEGRLAPGQTWIQESIIGSQFIASYQPSANGVCVSITGRAHVLAETTCRFDPDDPFAFGIPCASTCDLQGIHA